MSSINTISIEKLARLWAREIPVLIDVRIEEDFAPIRPVGPVPVSADPRTGTEFAGLSAVVICQRALFSHGAAGSGCRGPGRLLEGGFRPGARASCPLRWRMPARDRQPHGPNTRHAEGRPHRLSLADPPLRRSERRILGFRRPRSAVAERFLATLRHRGVT
jgi:hypothetical protein